MFYATHACEWRMQLDLLNRFCTFFHLKDWCGRDIFRTCYQLSENSLWFILSAMDASQRWHVRIAWLTDLTLKVYCMTQRWPFLEFVHVLTLSRIDLSPSPLSLIHWWAFFLLLTFFYALHSFFSHCCYLLFFFLAAAFSKPLLLFHEETGPRSQLYQRPRSPCSKFHKISIQK